MIVINYFWGDLEGENVFDFLGFLYKKRHFFFTFTTIYIHLIVFEYSSVHIVISLSVFGLSAFLRLNWVNWRIK